MPHVFDTSCRPWIQTDQGTRDEIAAAVAKCPTGSLQFYDGDSAPEAPVEAEGDALIQPRPDGPLILHGDFKIINADGSELQAGERVVLCRCGKSANKPFCDGSHARSGFDAP